MKEEILFYEKQILWKHWAIFGITMLIVFLIKTLVLSQKINISKENIMQSFGNPVFWSFLLIILLLSLFIRLETFITQDGIYIRYFPLYPKSKFYPWSRIADAYVYNNSIKNYKRLEKKEWVKVRVYNVPHKTGLKIIFNTGRSLSVQTSRPEELQEVLSKLNAQRKQK